MLTINPETSYVKSAKVVAERKQMSLSTRRSTKLSDDFPYPKSRINLGQWSVANSRPAVTYTLYERSHNTNQSELVASNKPSHCCVTGTPPLTSVSRAIPQSRTCWQSSTPWRCWWVCCSQPRWRFKCTDQSAPTSMLQVLSSGFFPRPRPLFYDLVFMKARSA